MSPAGLRWYGALIAATGAERIVELFLSRANAAWALERGGRESGRGHFPAMVALHSGLLVGALAEAAVTRRRFVPAVGWPALGVTLAAQGLRYWCIGTLGRRWNTRIVVVPGLPLVTRGPYRWLKHPNYVVVALEGLALPLVARAWWTATAFTALNAVLLLGFRIPAEERALEEAA